MDPTSIVSDVPPLLARFVADVELLRPNFQGATQEVRHLPDDRVTMMLRITLGAPASLAYRSGDVCIAGPRRHAMFKTVAAFPLAIVIRFQPGAAGSFLGFPATELRDRVVPIEQLWGSEGARLREAIVLAPGVHEMLEQVQTALVRRARALESPAERVARHAMQLMRNHGLARRIQDVAARLGVTERHLRRAFHASVGIAPKDYFRIQRLRRVLRASRRGINWAQAALDFGYYDQAHMIGEFRELMGVSPNAFLNSERPGSLAHSCSV